ncbi:MAG: DUF4058 family protein [Cyanobacteria bacterium P01_H01_bin.119]
MQSPFPGMDPYLEHAQLWPEVHSRLIVGIADALDDQLSQRYRVAIEKRVYISTVADSLLIGVPDVSVAVNQESLEASSGATTATIPQAQKITVPLAEERQERYLEIREATTGAIVTTIEVLSPTNKRSGEGRQAYLRKRNRILVSSTHLVEIDLLRGGESMPLLGASTTDYRILVSRSEERPQADLYGFSLREQMPDVVVPLMGKDGVAVIDLKAVLALVYRRGRYQLAIDYQVPPLPPLSEPDQSWAQALIKTA